MKARAVQEERRREAPVWHESIKDMLEAVEEKLLDATGSRVSTVVEVSNHLLSAGGKRLRPALVIMSSEAGGRSADRNRVLNIAAAIELIHMATLMHDDVIDHADARRGRVAANVFWGNRMSVLSGDYMLANAFRFLAGDGNQRITRAISEMTIGMTESEVLQAECEGSVEQWRRNYFQIIQDKTARFISVCCRCGAILAGSPPDEEELLASYGMDLGMAFQLIDDLLDIVGDPEITGKPIGSDLRDGKVTLPVLLALDRMAESQRTFARALIERGNLIPEEIEGLCRAVRNSDGISTAREHAGSYADRAIQRLQMLPPSQVREGLAALASQMVHRMS